MEPRPNHFPVYVSGQYLTSEHLNETQDFLWQEEKTARYLLDGNGIVKGLQADFMDGTLLKQVSITAGSAGTADGYIIQEKAGQLFDKGLAIQLSWITLPDGTQQLWEKAAFDKVSQTIQASSVTILSATELFAVANNLTDLPAGTATLDSFSITSSQVLSNYLVLAWVYITDTEDNFCVQGDCNTKGTQRNFTTRYFFVLNSSFPQLNTVNPELPLSAVARIKNLALSGSTAGVYQASFQAWGASLTELQPYFSTANTGKQLNIIAGLLSAQEQAIFNSAIAKLLQINASVSAQNCPQYYIAFAADVAKAINELVVFYNEYSRKYPVYNPIRIEQTIILGSFRQTGVDKWRYYFIPATEQTAQTFDTSKLRALFLRVLSLVNNFIIRTNINAQTLLVNKVLAIPSASGEALLQNRSIPYYYDILAGASGNDVLKNWNPQGGNLQNIFSYYDQVIPTRNSNPNMVAKLSIADWTGSNFFRIEGHIGLTKAVAISAINALIVNDGLPIQLLDCDVDYKGPQKWYDWYLQFSAFLNDSLSTLRANPVTKNYAYDPLKKIATNTLETTYRKPDQVKTILNDLTAYSGVFYNAAKTTQVQKAAAPKAKRLLKAAAPGAATVTTSINKDVIDNFTKVIPQQKITDLVKNFNDAVTEVADPKVKKLIILKDLAGLEYLGGVPKGGTFILLHSNGNVIGDGSLPYYYRVDQGRVFDQ